MEAHSQTAALLGVSVQQNRVIHVAEHLECLDQVRQVVPIHRTDVQEPKLLENLMRRYRRLEAVLQVVERAVDALANQRHLGQMLLDL